LVLRSLNMLGVDQYRSLWIDILVLFREGLCLPPSLDMADIFIESPAAYSIRYGDRDIDSAFLKVAYPLLKRLRQIHILHSGVP
jgi:hypothetical protein